MSGEFNNMETGICDMRVNNYGTFNARDVRSSLIRNGIRNINCIVNGKYNVSRIDKLVSDGRKKIVISKLVVRNCDTGEILNYNFEPNKFSW